MRFFAQMVGRNEASRFLEPVLARLRQIVQEIVFTDDSSDDATPDIALAYGAHVMQTNEPLFVKNEGLLRNLAWKNLCQYAEPGDWILAIDCDEMLYGVEYLPKLFDQSSYDVLGIEFFHMWNDTHYRVDKAWKPTMSSRLFRFYQGGEFLNRKLACGSEPGYVQELIRQGKALWKTGLRMQHLGYVRDEDKLAKHKRYMELDAGDFHSRAHLESILDTSPTLVPWVD